MLYTIEMLYRSMGKITSLEIINDHDVLIRPRDTPVLFKHKNYITNAIIILSL